MTYKEIAKKYLESNGITIGDTIKINKEDISYEGILLDRSEAVSYTHLEINSFKIF